MSLAPAPAKLQAHREQRASIAPAAGASWEPISRTIIRTTAEFFGVSVADIVGQRRCALIVRSRHVAYYLCRTMTPRSYPEIGKSFSGRDHSTIHWGVHEIGRKISRDPSIAADVSDIADRVVAARAAIARPQPETGGFVSIGEVAWKIVDDIAVRSGRR